MAKLKYKKGNKVRITCKLHGHNFKTGEVVKIQALYTDSDHPYYRASNSKDFWYIEDDEVEPVYEEAMTFRPYPPPISLEDINPCKAIPINMWEPKFPGYALLYLSVQVFRDYGNGWVDVCDDDGNCLKVSKKNLHKPIIEYFKNDNGMKVMKDAVLKVAKDLLKANNTVTTLEIKTELRRDYPYYFWTQQVVSDYMAQFAGDGIFTYVDTGTYRIYSLASAATVAATAGPVSKRLVAKPALPGVLNTGRILVKQGKGRPRKAIKTKGGMVDRIKVLVLVQDPSFENITIGGTLVTKADIRAQKKSPKGYLTSAKLNKVQYIGIGGTNYQVV